MINIGKPYSNKLHICITQELVEEYNEHYLKLNKRAKKPPIKEPYCPTLNKFTSMVRMVQNQEKQKYKEFMFYILDKYDIPKLNIEDCEIQYLLTYPTLTRRDLDNATLNSKFFGDAFVEYELLKDDSYFNVHQIGFNAQYKKNIKMLDIDIFYNSLCS